jgi:hypothetical protein
MEPHSRALFSSPLANPFHESQAKTFGDRKLASEFCPTSTYLSLFNEQHEILLGSRGSGKTAILRMLTYSSLRQLRSENPATRAFAEGYYGFYIPLHLEFMASLSDANEDGTGHIEFFQFAFNCIACKAFLREISAIVADRASSPKDSILLEARVIEHCARIWRLSENWRLSNLNDVRDAIEESYFQQAAWRDGTLKETPLFAKHLFAPILAVLPGICSILEIDARTCHWLACVDEAEFLKPAYIRCFNTFMRSDKRPIVLKLATLPYKYCTLQTLAPGICAESNGNDFNFRPIDLAWDSSDFRRLADHLIERRCSALGVFADPQTLESFVGQLGKDDLKDYFKAQVGPDRASDEKILEGIVQELSPDRRARYNLVKENPERVLSDYFKKFSPLYYLRLLRKESSPGNRGVGLFAGPSMIRRAADGNPRRFIQILHDMFEGARQQRVLSPSAQHRILADFVERECERSAGLPEYGLLLEGILKKVALLMEQRVHGDSGMIEAGFSFSIQEALLTNQVVRAAMELGVAYSFLFVDSHSLVAGLTPRTEFRLAHVVAIKYWLPMRKGSTLVLQSKHAKDLVANRLLTKVPTTTRESTTAISTLQLDLFDDPMNWQ